MNILCRPSVNLIFQTELATTESEIAEQELTTQQAEPTPQTVDESQGKYKKFFCL